MFEYKVVKSYELDSLAKEVEGLLSEGWQLMGGAQADHLHGWYFQTMVRKTEISSVDVEVLEEGKLIASSHPVADEIVKKGKRK